MAVLVGFLLCGGMGLLTVFSTADWAHLPALGRWMRAGMGKLALGSWFGTLDNFASNWCLPFTALAITLLVGWVWTPRRAAPELLASGEADTFPRWVLVVWGVLVRWVAPIAIIVVFLNSTGFLRL